MVAAVAARSHARDNGRAPAGPRRSRRRVGTPHGALVVACVAFTVLAAAAFFVGTIGADTTVRDHVLAGATPDVVKVMRIVNVAGDWKLLLPATLLMLAVFHRARRTWWLWIALMVAAPIAEGLLKIAVGRSRPFSPAYGFPSGHATAAAAYFGALIYLAEDLSPTVRRIVRTSAVTLMVLVGIARVMLRAHWPSDVVGGFALGLALASAAAIIAAEEQP
jgi:membrane-associated phospholipid phosphatase